jgi:hypothetical protein
MLRQLHRADGRETQSRRHVPLDLYFSVPPNSTFVDWTSSIAALEVSSPPLIQADNRLQYRMVCTGRDLTDDRGVPVFETVFPKKAKVDSGCAQAVPLLTIWFGRSDFCRSRADGRRKRLGPPWKSPTCTSRPIQIQSHKTDSLCQ